MFRKLTSSIIDSKSSQILRLISSKNDGLTPISEPGLNNCNIPIVDFEDPDHLPLPTYPARLNEPLEQKKQRLIYQSRKRGMLENDLILSTFAALHLKSFNENQVKLYDQLINGPTNDWDIYYWATGVKPIPEQYNNEIMDLLKEHVKNSKKEVRTRQPDL